MAEKLRIAVLGMAHDHLWTNLRQLSEVEDAELLREFSRMLLRVLPGYRELFCGDSQVLNKLKGILSAVENDAFQPAIRRLKKIRQLEHFHHELLQLAGDCP